MDVEWEASFANIDKLTMRKRLNAAGAKLLRAEYLQKRVVFNLPKGHEIKGAWLRVRDEGNRITMSLKVIDGENIDSQRETQLIIDNFENAVSLLESTGCDKKAFQESKRELWKLDGAEITIDEWPFLEPFVEIEGDSEEQVKRLAEKLGLDYSEAVFDSVDYLYSLKYNLSKDEINNNTPQIVFSGDNPFIDRN